MSYIGRKPTVGNFQICDSISVVNGQAAYTMQVGSDDNIKSSSFAKVLSTTVIETYDDGSFIVPCSLMC